MSGRSAGDERGRGVADPSHLADGVRELVEAMLEPDRVAEDPELHLLPHIRRACGQPASELRLEGHTLRLRVRPKQ